MTNRVTNLEAQQGKIEAYQAQIEKRFTEHLASIVATLDKANRTQQTMLGKVGETLDAHHKRELNTLDAMHGNAVACVNATKEVTEAAATGESFVRTHHEIALTASRSVQHLAQEAMSTLQTKMREIKEAADKAMMPAIQRVQELTEAQYKRRFMFAFAGFALCLSVVAGTTYFTQRRLSGDVLTDAGSWRMFITG